MNNPDEIRAAFERRFADLSRRFRIEDVEADAMNFGRELLAAWQAACALSPPSVVANDEVIRFLLGEGPLDGVHFGDKHPTERGAFWWRKHLRAALASPPSPEPICHSVECIKAAGWDSLNTMEPPDEWMFELLQAQHSTVPEDQRPHSWSDLNDEQEARFKTAARTAWRSLLVQRLPFASAMHASAPPDHKCSDCTMDNEACPICYGAWWKQRHPHTVQVASPEPVRVRYPEPFTVDAQYEHGWNACIAEFKRVNGGGG